MYHNVILNTKKSIEDKDLNKIEQKFNIKIPEAIREHFLLYNGGYPENAAFVCENGNTYIVNHFIPIKNKEGLTVEKVLKLLKPLGTDEAIIPDWLVPFADEAGGNLFCFSVREKDRGSIYYYDHEFEYGDNPEKHITYLAESMKVFIDSLIDCEEDFNG